MNLEVAYGSDIAAQATVSTTNWYPGASPAVYSSASQTAATYVRGATFLLTKVAAFTNFATGDYIWAVSGTGLTKTGWHKFTKVDADNATLDTDLGPVTAADVVFSCHKATNPFTPAGKWYQRDGVLRRVYPYSSLTAGSLIVVDAGGAELTRIYASNNAPSARFVKVPWPVGCFGLKGDGTLAGGISVAYHGS